MRAFAPLPITDMFAPDYTKARGDSNIDYAWMFSDGQGMYPRPPGYHGGIDWFAPAESPIRSPGTGRVVRADPSRGTTGSVFGGVLAIEQDDGIAWVMRHVIPEAPLGSPVSAGQRVARVSPWSSGWSHLHLEPLTRWPSTYSFFETFDPRTIEWVTSGPLEDEAPVADLYFEELPHDQGGTGPVVAWRGTGSTVKAVAINKAKGRIVSTVRDAAGVGYVLWWAPDTYPNLPIFGPWIDEGARQRTIATRERNTGRTMRPFRGRQRSLYPTPA